MRKVRRRERNNQEHFDESTGLRLTAEHTRGHMAWRKAKRIESTVEHRRKPKALQATKSYKEPTAYSRKRNREATRGLLKTSAADRASG